MNFQEMFAVMFLIQTNLSYFIKNRRLNFEIRIEIVLLIF